MYVMNTSISNLIQVTHWFPTNTHKVEQRIRYLLTISTRNKIVQSIAMPATGTWYPVAEVVVPLGRQPLGINLAKMSSVTESPTSAQKKSSTMY
jgi:hypothetical protein